MSVTQLVDDLEKRRAEVAASLLGASLAPTSPVTPGAVNPIVAEAIASPTFVDVAKAVTPEVTVPVSPQDTAPVPGALKPVIPAPQVDLPETGSFYDMLIRNDAYRRANQETMERNEKANRARTAIAAVTDALASLGNLVGTTQGAFSQPQTYQTPFVTEQVEADRARARQLADRLQANDQAIRLAQQREEQADRSLDRQLAVQQAITDRAAMNNQNKLELEDKRQSGRIELEKLKQGGRVSLKQMDIEYKENKDEMQAALRQQGIRISAGRLSEMIRHNQTIEKIRENGGGGGVGGYETVIIRDELGREVRRKRVPLGSTIDLDEDDSKAGGFDLGNSGSKAGGFNLG